MQFAKFALPIAFCALLAGLAHAEPAGPKAGEGRCFLFGMEFSEGAVARGGTGTMVCQADSSWGKTMSQAAGCIYESKVYSTGALTAIGDAKDTKLECLSDGTWSPVPVVKKP